MGRPIYYEGSALEKKDAQKIISVLRKTNIISTDTTVEALLGSTLMWGISDAILCTDKEVIYFVNSQGLLPKTQRYAYEGIVSVTVQTKKVLEELIIGIDASGEVTLDITATPNDTRALADFIRKKISAKRTPQTSSSDADEIQKLFKLKEQGILSEEEFNAKKKQLLGI